MRLKQLPVPACICDAKGNILQTNKLFEQLIEGKCYNIYNLASPSERQKIFNNIKSLSQGLHKSFIITLSCHNYKTIVTEIHATPYNNDQVLLLIHDITNFKKKEEELLSSIITSEEKERRRIATELHDNLSPVLSTIKLYASLLKKKIPGRQKDLAGKLEELTEQAIKIAKEISYNITPSILDDFGLAVAIKKFADFVNATQSVDIQIKTDNYTLTERQMAESILYHIAKELINNTIKHSKATKAVLELRSTDNLIILYYRDNGQGFDPQSQLDKGKGLGLRNITHKISSFNGTCEIISSPGQGMMAIITLPTQKSKSQSHELHNSNNN